MAEEEGFGDMSSLMFAGTFGEGLNAGMVEAAGEKNTAVHDSALKKLMSGVNDAKEDLRIFRPVTKAEMNDERRWIIGERELGVGLPVFIPHKNFGPCLAVRGTIRELWNEPGVKEMHFLVHRLHPMSVSKQNSDTAHFLVPIRCRKHGINIPWLLPVPIGLISVEVSSTDKEKTRLTTVVWKNDKPTELTTATLEEAYQVMNGTLGEEKKLGMRALMEIQKKQTPELFGKYLEHSVSLIERYGGAGSSVPALNGGDGPAILMQDRIEADPNKLSGVLGEIMPLALGETTAETSNTRIACMFILNQAPWMRTCFIKMCRFPDLKQIMRKKHMAVQREARAVSFSKSWTVLNRPDTNAVSRKVIARTFVDSFASLGSDDEEE